MRIIFMGSPTFAVHPLRALHAAGHEIVAVVTQPDRAAGRQRQLLAPPVKQAAIELGLPILQPSTLRDAAVVEELQSLHPDMGVVAAYGEILRRNVLGIPPLGYLNLHPSLLPLHRGPTPVAGAILAGEAETGISIMRLDPGMDSGPILSQIVRPLEPTARAGALTDELFVLGSQLLVDILPAYAAGDLVPQSQDASRVTLTQLLKKEDGLISWQESAILIERMTRAYDPWPGCFTTWKGQQMRILQARVDSGDHRSANPGTLVGKGPQGGPLIGCGDGLLEVLELQPAGKRPMPGSAWLNGLQQPEGSFGD